MDNQEERMRHELELLEKVDRAGLKDEALELAIALGLTKQFQEEKQQCESVK